MFTACAWSLGHGEAILADVDDSMFVSHLGAPLRITRSPITVENCTSADAIWQVSALHKKRSRIVPEDEQVYNLRMCIMPLAAGTVTTSIVIHLPRRNNYDEQGIAGCHE